MSREAIALRKLPSKELEALGRRYRWSLSLPELKAVQKHFRKLRRDPTDLEMETLAQTWSEHCKHKTFTSPIVYKEGRTTRRIGNLLKETVMAATRRLGSPRCLSVFKDNAGIVRFDRVWALAFKVETHNHPSAVEPYGGAATGVGGVVRDVLGAGLGAKPVLNTDVFCFAPPTFDGPLPAGVLHPRRTLRGVVAGVRDYGNRMGIPTGNGAIVFHPGYLQNPLVFCGTLGMIPVSKIAKTVRPGDLIVAVGGRTGRDGLRGATFSSAPLESSSDSSAVQIGHPIMEKRLLDALLQARDKGLYRSVTDCGAGGFSSAVGELGAGCGARVSLDAAPLKHQGLKSWEIWLSESQERMVLAVPERRLASLMRLFEVEGVEGSVLGRFTKDGKLTVLHGGEVVGELAMSFLHDGLPRALRKAVFTPVLSRAARPDEGFPAGWRLHRLLSDLNTASKEWVVRQYDHEVQGQTVMKPFTGTGDPSRPAGPQDACVIWPIAVTGNMKSRRGVAVACGAPRPDLADDPRAMALACVDEALRNLVAAGGDPARAALLDNFCWGDPEDPATLGALVRCAEGLRDAALAYQTPFVSGKDSLNNTFRDASGKARGIPGTLLVSAMTVVPDVALCPGSDLKAAGHPVYLVGAASGCVAPDLDLAPRLLRSLHKAILAKTALAVHDLSEGGLAVAAAESAFGGGVGLELALAGLGEAAGGADPALRSAKEAGPADAGASASTSAPGAERSGAADQELLFGEAATRFLVEVDPSRERVFLRALRGLPVYRIGGTIREPVFRVIGRSGKAVLSEPLEALRSTWSRALPEAVEARAPAARKEAHVAA